MRIGFDAKRLFHNNTGLGNYSRDLVRILGEFYTDHQYFLYNPKLKKIDRLPKFDHIIERLPNGFTYKKLPSFWRTRAIVSDLIKDKIEIFHGLSAEIPFDIQKTGIKTIVTIHDIIFLRYPHLYKSIDRKIYTRKMKNAIDNADLIVAISEQTKKDIITFFDTSEDRIKVIYQGCHSAFKEITHLKTLDITRKKYQLPERFILNVGTLEPRKNALNIVKAIQGTSIPLVLVGRKTHYFDEISNYISQQKMEHQVIHLQNLSIEELAHIYKLAEIFVYPSIFEGFGIPIIEALYSKTPVISSIGSCFSEAGGPNSIYVYHKSINDLKEAILSLWESKPKKQEMIEKGLSFVQKFNDNHIAEHWIQTYQEILKK